MDLEFVPELGATVLGSAWRSARSTVLVAREDYRVVLLSRGVDRVIVKVAGAAAPAWARAEEWERLIPLTSRVLAAGVSVPEMVMVDTSLQRWPARVQMRGFLEGQTWAEAVPTFAEALAARATWRIGSPRPTDQHHADTAQVCRELGLAPVRFD